MGTGYGRYSKQGNVVVLVYKLFSAKAPTLAEGVNPYLECCLVDILAHFIFCPVFSRVSFIFSIELGWARSVRNH